MSLRAQGGRPSWKKSKRGSNDILKAELARNANEEGTDGAEMAALGLAGQRLHHLMGHRRTLLRKSS